MEQSGRGQRSSSESGGVMEWWSNGVMHFFENYATRLSCWVVPPSSIQYYITPLLHRSTTPFSILSLPTRRKAFRRDVAHEGAREGLSWRRDLSDPAKRARARQDQSSRWKYHPPATIHGPDVSARPRASPAAVRPPAGSTSSGQVATALQKSLLPPKRCWLLARRSCEWGGRIAFPGMG